MAVPEQIPYVGYIANGVTKEFPITFDLHDDRYLVVTVNKEKPTVGSYTVSNGKVLFLTAPENNAQVELYRSTTLDRDIDYKSYDNSFRPAAINFDFDKTWQVLQEQHMVDAQLLARVKEEVEWRRVNDNLLQHQINILNDVMYGVFNKASQEYLNDKLKAITDAIDIAAAAGAGANGWTDQLIQMESGSSLRKEWKDKFDRPSILGQCGISIISDRSDAHYGWGGILNFESGKWVHICRKAAGHGTLNNAQLVALDSYDKGQTWVNERVILTSTQHDLRPDAPKLMANNRGGFMVNRASDGNGHFSPLFLYSDDSGVTWQQKVVTTTSPYTFTSTGGFLDFPASVGGADNTGFIAYGYLSAGNYDALYTLDNGETWQQRHEIASLTTDIKAMSEWSGCRLGNQNKWIFILRNTLISTNTWNPNALVYCTDDPLNWGVPVQSTFGLGGNPPCIVYDDKTDTVNLLNTSRGGRPIRDLPENCIAYAQIDADTAYTSKLVLPDVKYSVLTNLPHWATGYLAPFKVDGRWFTSLTCGEVGFNGGGNSIQVLLGDFVASAADTMKIVKYMNKQLKSTQYLELTSYGDNSTYPLRIYNQARDGYILVKNDYLDFNNAAGNAVEFNTNTAFKFKDPLLLGGLTSSTLDKVPVQVAVQAATLPSIYSISSSTTVRNHVVFYNANGLVGSISTSGTATTYATTSDETLKDFGENYDALKAIAIIKADPVRNYTWKQSGEKAVGWGAQTSYAVDEALAVKGGWYLDDVEVPKNTEGATYVAWGMDYSKRVPYLWAVVANLLERIEALENNSQ